MKNKEKMELHPEEIGRAQLPPHIERDFYEYFCELGDEPLKQGYEKLVAEILSLAEIPKEECSPRWEGTFDPDKEGEGPHLVVSRGQDEVRFKLEYQGETADLDNLLAGLNSFIQRQRPQEKRRLYKLQMYCDQRNCLWFVTEDKLRELCPILHSGWRGYPDHFCTITRLDAMKEGGREKVLELAKRSAERELERLSSMTWKVYPARCPPRYIEVTKKMKKLLLDAYFGIRNLWNEKKR